PAQSSHRCCWAAWRYWRTSRIFGSGPLSSTGMMTTEPVWRTMSRRPTMPEGSRTWSVVTQNAGPRYTSREESTRALGLSDFVAITNTIRDKIVRRAVHEGVFFRFERAMPDKKPALLCCPQWLRDQPLPLSGLDA